MHTHSIYIYKQVIYIEGVSLEISQTIISRTIALKKKILSNKIYSNYILRCDLCFFNTKLYSFSLFFSFFLFNRRIELIARLKFIVIILVKIHSYTNKERINK